DRMDPGGELPRWIVAVARAMDAQEGVLREVLHPLLIAEPLAQEALDARLVPFHQELEAVLVAVGVALEELLVRELVQLDRSDHVPHGTRRPRPRHMGAIRKRQNPARPVCTSERFHGRKITDSDRIVEGVELYLAG